MKKQIRAKQEERKQLLKELANDIRAIKAEMKKQYKQLKAYMDFNGIDQNYDGHDMRQKYNSGIRKGYYKILLKISVLQSNLYELRQKARCTHIIYCLYNGTPFEKIEPKHNVDKYEWDTSGYYYDIKAALAYQEEYKNFLNLQQIAV